LRFEVACAGLGCFGFELLKLVLKGLFTRHQPLDVDVGVLGLLLQSFLETLERAFAGDGFDAANTRGDGTFVDDLADPDIASAADMRAAAELLAEGVDLHDAHFVAVLFAE
jgi:hypothetical protein